jgi:hypothetical protein
VVFILFDLDLKIYLNGLKTNKRKKRRESLPAVAGGLEARPSRPAFPSLR